MRSTLLLAAILPAIAFGQTKLTIPPGRISQTVPGQIKSTAATYRLKVAKGQHVIVNAMGTTSGFEVLATVTLPNGSQDGNKGKPNYVGVMPSSGVLSIRVATNLMASTKSSGSFLLEVVAY